MCLVTHNRLQTYSGSVYLWDRIWIEDNIDPESLFLRPVCWTRSKAWHASRNAAAHILRSLMSFSIILITLCTWSIVKCCSLKPNWGFGNNSWSTITWVGLPGLCIRIMTTVFYCVGEYWILTMTLNICLSSVMFFFFVVLWLFVVFLDRDLEPF